MSKHAEVFMSNGSSYQLVITPKEVYDIITHSDGKPLKHIHPFKTAHGDTVYIHSSHVVSIVEYESLTEENKENRDLHVSDEKRKNHNVETVKKFKKDIDDNME